MELFWLVITYFAGLATGAYAVTQFDEKLKK